MQQKKTCFSDAIRYGKPLSNTYQKLTREKKLTVAYYGGSITAGDGSSDVETKSWRAKTNRWLRDRFPEAVITEVNAAYPATGSELGVYRLRSDLLAFRPDLVFLEYAINDSYGDPMESVQRWFETIIRTVKTELPDCDIVTLLTTDQRYAALSLQGELYNSAQVHASLSRHYHLPVLNVGHALLATMGDNWEPVWSDYFSDTTHPADRGHQVYFDCVEEFLHNELLCTDHADCCPTAEPLPEPVSDRLTDGDIRSFYGADMKEFVLETVGFSYHDDACRIAYRVHHQGYYGLPKDRDAVFTFRFVGTEAALLTNLEWNSTLRCSVDGGEEKELTGGKPFAVATGLAYGEHTVKVQPGKVIPNEGVRFGGIFTRNEEMKRN